MTKDIAAGPCWIVDILPRQVPADAGGRYFAVDELRLGHPWVDETYQRFARLILGLYCYFDLDVAPGDGNKPIHRPDPSLLAELVLGCVTESDARGYLVIEFPTEGSKIIISGDFLNLSVYAPTDELLDTIRQLAAGEGLFVWGPVE